MSVPNDDVAPQRDQLNSAGKVNENNSNIS